MYDHILVPVLFTEARDSDGAIDIAKKLINEGGRITLIHVMEDVPYHAQAYLPDNFLSSRESEVADALSDLAKTVPGGASAISHGHASRAILDWAGENKPDCIVVASHRPGMQDLLLGSTAAKIVRHAQCAVHVIR